MHRRSCARAGSLRWSCSPRAAALPLLAPTYYVQFATKVLILGILAMALNLVVGFGGLVSMCHARLLRACRLRARARGAEIRGGLALAHACRSRSASASLAALVDRRAVAAHARHLLHHGDARLRRDAVLLLPRYQVRRRLGRHLHQSQARGACCSASPSSISTRRASFYWVVLALASLTIAASAHRADALAVRPRARGRARQRAARPLARLPDLPLAAHRLRDLRRARRPRRLFRRRAVRLRGAADARLAPLGDSRW